MVSRVSASIAILKGIVCLSALQNKEMGKKRQLSDDLGKQEAGSKGQKGCWLHYGGGKSEKRTGKWWLDLAWGGAMVRKLASWMATGTGFALDDNQRRAQSY